MTGPPENSKPGKQRLDLLVFERGLAESRERAQALILAGKVQVDGQLADKPGRFYAFTSRVVIEQPLPYVSRGGVKLAAALSHFEITVHGRVCMDVGTSTGGFVDCLLQRGAARVHAVDTGAGQIAWKLRNDPRVVLHERTNARYLQPETIGEPVSLITCDVSFISVTLLIPSLAPLLLAAGDWIILVKPQFEVGRECVGVGGIVRDPESHAAACHRVAGALAASGFAATIIDSPIHGVEGNREFLLHARRTSDLQL